MSRHIIPGFDARFTVVVGWDNPLQTFFTQVARADDSDDDDNDPVLLWIGGTFGEVTDPAALVAPLALYATLTEDHVAQLGADRDAKRGSGPTPTQRANLAALRRPQ